MLDNDLTIFFLVSKISKTHNTFSPEHIITSKVFSKKNGVLVKMLP